VQCRLGCSVCVRLGSTGLLLFRDTRITPVCCNRNKIGRAAATSEVNHNRTLEWKQNNFCRDQLYPCVGIGMNSFRPPSVGLAVTTVEVNRHPSQRALPHWDSMMAKESAEYRPLCLYREPRSAWAGHGQYKIQNKTFLFDSTQ
jgi:hypothetical protein